LASVDMDLSASSIENLSIGFAMLYPYVTHLLRVLMPI
jgi:hypothetical protein